MGRRPLLAVVVSLTAGVALGAWLPQEPIAWACASCATLVAWAVVFRWRSARTPAAPALLAFLSLGILLCQGALAGVVAEEVRLASGEATVAGRVAGPVQTRAGAVAVELEAVRLRAGRGTFDLTRRLQAVIEGESARFADGERLLLRGRLAPIRGDRNVAWFPRPVSPWARRIAVRLQVSSPVWVRRGAREPRPGPTGAVRRWRDAASGFWAREPSTSAAILDALTTGERAAIAPEVERAFFRAGLTHLLAISGMNVGFLALAAYLLLRRLLAAWSALAERMPVHRPAAAAAIPLLWFFAVFSGGQVPVVRAGIMAGAGFVALVALRRIDPLQVFALALGGMLAHDPLLLFSPAFQLSFAAVLGLILMAPRLAPPEDGTVHQAGRLRRFVKTTLLTCGAASLVTAPLVAFHFQQVNLVGPVANLLAVPYTGLVLLPAAWLTLAAAALWAPAGEVLRVAAVALVGPLIGTAELFALRPWSSVLVPRPPLLATLALLALAAALVAPRGTGAAGRARRAALALVVPAVMAWWLGLRLQGPRAVFLDVGQGLAAAVLLPEGATLVDAGPAWRGGDAGRRIVGPALRALGVRRIQRLALTHAHPDHSGGLPAVLEEFAVGEVWCAADLPSALPAEIAAALGRWEARGGRARAFGSGDRREGRGGELVEFLHPPHLDPEAPRGTGDAGGNERSLVFQLGAGGARLLFTGDVGPRVAAGLRLRPPAGAWRVLQVPHHGGSAAAARALCAAFRPTLSVIPVGRNAYGHPRPEAVSALETTGAVARTDRDGAVFVRWGKAGLRMRTWSQMARGRTWAERLRWLAAGT